MRSQPQSLLAPMLLGVAASVLAAGLAVPAAAGEPAAAGKPVEAGPREPDGPAPVREPWLETDTWRIGTGSAVFRDAGDRVVTRVGGWIDATYQDTNRQGKRAAVDLTHANLHVDTRWRSWQFFVETEWEHQKDYVGFPSERDFELEQLYLHYAFGDDLGLRMGRFHTPFGYWVPIHWDILVDTIVQPIHVGLEWVPEQQVGAELAGRWLPSKPADADVEVAWSTFVGIGGDELGETHVKRVGVGADLHLAVAERWQLGLSGYRRDNPDFDDRTETSGVLYGEVRLLSPLLFRTELVGQHRERTALAPYQRDVVSLYGKLRWDFHRLAYLSYRYGYGDEDDEDLRETVQRQAQTFTIGLRPHRAVRIKLEYSNHRFKGTVGRDFDYWGASLGVLF